MILAKRNANSQKVPFKARLTVYQEGSESCDYGVAFLVDEEQVGQNNLINYNEIFLSSTLLSIGLVCLLKVTNFSKSTYDLYGHY